MSCIVQVNGLDQIIKHSLGTTDRAHEKPADTSVKEAVLTFSEGLHSLEAKHSLPKASLSSMITLITDSFGNHLPPELINMLPTHYEKVPHFICIVY